MLGLGLLPIVVIRKPVKMWLSIFFLTGGVASLIDQRLTKAGRLMYPVRFMKDWTRKHVLFDLLILPIICLLFIQVTLNAKPAVIIRRALFFSLPLTAFEWVLERKTDLIRWLRWSSAHSFFGQALFLLTFRGIIGCLLQFSKTNLLKQMK